MKERLNGVSDGNEYGFRIKSNKRVGISVNSNEGNECFQHVKQYQNTRRS